MQQCILYIETRRCKIGTMGMNSESIVEMRGELPEKKVYRSGMD
jgi:hypothetical protein